MSDINDKLVVRSEVEKGVTKGDKTYKLNLPCNITEKSLAGPLSSSLVNSEELDRKIYICNDIKNHPNGYVEEVFVDEYSFEEERRRLIRENLDENGIVSIEGRKRRSKRNFEDPGNLNENGFKGPWAGYDYEDDPSKNKIYGVSVDDLKKLEENKAKTYSVNKRNLSSEGNGVVGVHLSMKGNERTVFHRSTNYENGRSFVSKPIRLSPLINVASSEKDVVQKNNFLTPKKCKHTFTGHTKPVTCIQLYPNYCHLLLSSSMDGKVRIWDTYGDRKVLRTYMGHDKAVKSIEFVQSGVNMGNKFISSGYDGHLKYWDTETGKCISSINLSNRKDKLLQDNSSLNIYSTSGSNKAVLPHCTRCSPSNPDVVLIACSNKKIYQIDIRNSIFTNEYKEHTGEVNSVEFLDEQGKVFASSADDKTIKIWETGIPVVVKNFSETDMCSGSSIALHPNNNDFVVQFQNNVIQNFSIKQDDVIKPDMFSKTNKRFIGHLSSGYAINPGLSPDGCIIASGDSGGRLWFWSWDTSKVIKSLQAHDRAILYSVWHKRNPNTLFTCSWDNTIKMWN